MLRITPPALLLTGFWALSLPLFAAPLPSDQILRNEQQRLDLQREQQQRRPDVFLTPSAPAVLPPPAPVAGPCFTVRRIEFEGAPADWLPWLQPAANRLSGQCLDINAINQLVASLTDLLVERGFVTSRVYVPEQNLQSGVLRLVVIPGRVQSILLPDGTSDLSLRAAFPVHPGDILNLRDLEQGLEQLGRPSSQQATMELLPGDAPGESIVRVKRIRTRPVHLLLSEDNSGQMATGKNQLTGQVNADNVIGINDVLTVSQSQDADEVAHPRSKSQSFSWLLPWGKWSGYLSFSTRPSMAACRRSNRAGLAATPCFHSPACSTGTRAAKPNLRCS
jgi:hemolysin activation/secretion protein